LTRVDDIEREPAVVMHSDPERRTNIPEERPAAEACGSHAELLGRHPGPAAHVARRQVEILNALGFHLRPAERFVGLAHRFASDIKLYVQGKVSNGKSILDLMTLAAERGTRIDLEARGPDAEQAVAALADLVAARFYEDDDGNALQPRGEHSPGGCP
jgi:phosphocarrier protein